MLLKTARDNYYEAAGTTSTIARQLALGGIAVIWLLTGGFDNNGHIHLTDPLAVAAGFVLLALLCDLGHYVWRTLAFWHWSDAEQEKLTNASVPNDVANETELGDVPGYISTGAWVWFYAKLVCLVVSYVCIGIALTRRTALG